MGGLVVVGWPDETCEGVYTGAHPSACVRAHMSPWEWQVGAWPVAEGGVESDAEAVEGHWSCRIEDLGSAGVAALPGRGAGVVGARAVCGWVRGNACC